MANAHFPPGLPGVKTKIENAERKVLIGGGEKLPGGIILDGSESRDPLNTGNLATLRAGMVLGRVTSGGRMAPSIIGVLASAHAESSTGGEGLAMTVSAATAVEINRRIGSSGTFKVTGPPSAGGTVATVTVTFSAVNTTTGVITISDIDADFIAGSFIQPTDGSENPLGLLDAAAKVTDQDENDVDVPANLLIGGHVADGGPINYPTDTALLTWLKARLNGGDGTTAIRGKFTFADDYDAA